MLEPVLKNPWVRAAAVLGALAAVLLLAYLLSPVLIPLFFAFLVAYVFDPVVDYFEKKRISRVVTIVALAAIALIMVLAIPLYLLPSIIDQAEELGHVAEERLAAESEGGGLLKSLGDRLPLRSLVEALGWAPEESSYDPIAVLTNEIADRIQESATTFLEDYGSDLVSFGQQAGSTVAGFFATIGRWMLGVVLIVGNFALFAFVAGYLLKDFDGIIEGAKDLVPPRYQERTFNIFSKIDSQLKGFLRGQAFVCLALGIMYAVGLTIAGVPFGLVLGLFGGIASFVPYLGLVLTIGPAVVLCIVQHGALDWHLAVVLATFGIAQFLEGTFITPKVVGEQVGLSPVWVILAVLVFGNALGFLGLLLAVPIAATLKVIVSEGLDVYRKSGVFQGNTA